MTTRIRCACLVIFGAGLAGGRGIAAQTRTLTTFPTALAPPTGVTFTPQSLTVTIQWQAAVGAAGYRVLRANDSTTPGTDRAASLITTTSFADGSLTSGTTYFYQIVAVSSAGTQAATPKMRYTVPSPTTTRTLTTTTSTPSISTAKIPVGVTVTPHGPGLHLVSWTPQSYETPCMYRDDYSGAIAFFGSGSSNTWCAFFEVWQTTGSSAPVRVHGPTNQGVNSYVAPLIEFIPPGGVTFTVIREENDVYGDFINQTRVTYAYTSPPQPQAPGGFTVTETGPLQLTLTWQQVPYALAYRLFGTGQPSTGTRISGTSYVLNNLPGGSYTYQLASEYEAGWQKGLLSSASGTVHGIPPRSVAYLTKNNGVGSQVAAVAHYATRGLNNSTLDVIANNIGLVTGWDASNNQVFVSQSVDAVYANVTELGLGRYTRCWQWIVPGPPPLSLPGNRTVCLAENHGTPGQPPGSINGATLADEAWNNQALLGRSLIIKDPSGVTFTTLSKRGVAPGWQPWGFDFQAAYATTFDSEGPKYAPHACLACHGGTYDPLSGKVIGGTLLPIDPGLVAFSTSPGRQRPDLEESIRQINNMVAKSSPPQAVVDYINGLYNGQVGVAGARSQTNYIPASWSQQTQLYQLGVKPNCAMCHLASSAGHDFNSASNFFQNKALIYAALCTGHTMPHSETAYGAFWTKSVGPVFVPGYMLAILGYNSCP